MFRISVTNELEQLEGLAIELARFCEAEQLADETNHWLNVIVEELFVNFVTHGAREQGEFELTIACHANELHLTLMDDGQQFNPLEADLPDVEAALEDRSIGQLGLHLVRKVSTAIAYERLEERNVVTLTLPRLPQV